MEQIVNDADTDSDVVEEPVEPVESEVEPPSEPAVEPPSEPADDTDKDDGDDSGISGEQARKLRSEAANLRHRLKEAEANLESLRTELEQRDERLSVAEAGRLDAMIYSRAAGRLQNPADAVVFLDRGDLSADDVAGIDAAIEVLLAERSYLRSDVSIPQVDQGVQRERPRTKTFSDVMAEGLGWTGK